MNLPANCSEQDINKRFGDEAMDDENSRLCESCGQRFLWEDLVPEDGVYLCGYCLKESHDK